MVAAQTFGKLIANTRDDRLNKKKLRVEDYERNHNEEKKRVKRRNWQFGNCFGEENENKLNAV